MEAKDLRIGNITSAGVVSEILQDRFYVHDGESSLKSTWFDIQPIPITEEWLLKFGFETCGYDLLFWEHPKLKGFQLGGINWADKDYPEYQFLNYQIDDNTFSIHYVHQLQNLYFTLTGEELTIKE